MATYRLSADTTKFVSEMKKASDALKTSEKQYEAAKAKADLLGSAEERLSQKKQKAADLQAKQNKVIEDYRKVIGQIKDQIKIWEDQEADLKTKLDQVTKAEGDNSKAAKDLIKEINNIRTGINNANTVLDKQERSLADVEKKYYSTVGEVNKFNKALVDLKNKQEDTVEITEDASDALEEEAEALRKQQEEAEKARKEQEEFNENTEEFVGSTLSLQNALSTAADLLRDFGEVIDGITNKFEDLIKNGINATVDALVDLGKYSLTTGISFEKQMSKVAAVMGISKNSDDYSALLDAAKLYGETTQFTATQAAEALTYLAQAGKKRNEAIEYLPNVLNLATAGDLDLGQAASYLVDAESALGDDVANNISGFVDKMAKAATETNTSVSLMFEAVLGLGTVGRALDMNELIATLAKLGDYYLKGSEGGTKLRNIISRLQSPTKDAAKALDTLGVKVYDAEDNMKSLGQIFTEINMAMDKFGYTQKQRNNVFNNIFNVRDKAAAEALGIEFEDLAKYAMEFAEGIEQINFEDIDNYEGSLAELVNTLKDCDGAAEKMAATMRDNLWGSLKDLSSAAEGFGLAIYDVMLPGVRDAVDNVVTYIRELVDGINYDFNILDWDQHKDKSIFKEGTRLKIYFNEIGKAISDFTAKIPKILEKHTPKIVNVIKRISDIIVKIFDYLPILIDSVLPKLLTHIDNLLSKVPGFIDVVLPKFIDILSWIIDNAPFLITLLYGLQGFSAVGAGALDIGGIVAGLSVAAKAAGTTLGAAFTAVAPFLGALAAVAGVLSAIIGLLGTAYATSENFRNYVALLFEDFMEDSKKNFEIWKGDIVRLFQALGFEVEDFGEVVEIVLNFVEKAATLMAFYISQLISFTTTKSQIIREVVIGLIDVIKNLALGLYYALTGDMDKAETYFKNMVSSVGKTVVNMWNDARNGAADFAVDFADFLVAMQNTASNNPITFKITSEVDTQKFSNDLNLVKSYGLPDFDPNKYNSINLLTNGGKGWGSGSSSTDYVNEIMNGINNATANITNTNTNKVTSNTTNNNNNQNIVIMATEPIDENTAFKYARDLRSAQLTAI